MGFSKAAIEARRLKLAEIMLANPGARSIRQLVVLLANAGISVSRSTVGRDRQAVIASWRERRQEMVDQYASEDFARSDAAIEAIWPQVLAGKGWAVDRLLGLLTYRADVLGTKVARQKVDIGDALARVLEGLSRQGSSADN